MTDHIRLNKGDDGIDLTGTVTFTDEVTLAGSTMTFSMVDRQGTVKINGRACTVTIDDTANTIDFSVALASGDTDTEGRYRSLLKITFSDARVRTVLPDPKIIEVVDALYD